MIRMISGDDISRAGSLLEKVFRARHQVFVGKMGWSSLRRDDGLDCDEFDTERAIHLVGEQSGRVASYSRLLPTTAPHLLDTIYPELLQGASAPRRPDVYEWTRLFTDEGKEAASLMGRLGRELFVAVAEFCAASGITSLIAEADPMWIPRLLQLGWEARPLALPMKYDGKPVMVLEAHLTPRTIAQSRRVLNVRGEVLTPYPLSGIGALQGSSLPTAPLLVN